MKYELKYGQETLDVTIQEGNLLGILQGKDTPGVTSYKEELLKSLENPVGTKPLGQLLQKGQPVTIVISDITRYWMRQDKVLPGLVEYLNNHGVPLEDIVILIANGTHRPAPLEEIQKLVTPELAEKVQVVNHYCEDEDLQYVGTTSRGTEVELNPLVVNRQTICIGAPTHHVMAGYGGGRKSILPGVASKKSINQNHLHALSLIAPESNPLIGNGKLEGNPLNEDMCEAAALAEPMLIINLCINPQGELAKIISGDLMQSWETACQYVDDMYGLVIEDKADIVIASAGGYPKDMSVYQATKVIDNVENAVKPGGTLVLIAECIEGGGHPQFFYWNQFSKAGNLYEALRADFSIPGYVYFLNCEQAARMNVIFLTAVPQEDLAPMGIKACHSLEELMELVDFKDKNYYVIPSGGSVIPTIKE